jgi:hypothetical protein
MKSHHSREISVVKLERVWSPCTLKAWPFLVASTLLHSTEGSEINEEMKSRIALPKTCILSAWSHQSMCTGVHAVHPQRRMPCEKSVDYWKYWLISTDKSQWHTSISARTWSIPECELQRESQYPDQSDPSHHWTHCEDDPHLQTK